MYVEQHFLWVLRSRTFLAFVLLWGGLFYIPSVKALYLCSIVAGDVVAWPLSERFCHYQ